MKQIIKFIFILLLGYSCNTTEISKTQSVITTEDRETLRYLKEVEWPKAYAEQDTVLLDRLLGEDFQFIEASGNRTDKKFELNWIKNNKTENDSFRYEIKRLDIYDNGTAIVAGTGHIVNDTIKSIYESSNILIKRKGVWKAIASQVSGVKRVE